MKGKIKDDYLFATWCKKNNREYLLKEWDHATNDSLEYKINEVSRSLMEKVAWVCPEGHPYMMPVRERTSKINKCPVCIGKTVITGINDLETRYPEVLIDWDYSKNTLDPKTIYYSSHKKVYWKCHVCGYESESQIYLKTTKNTKCDSCIGQIVNPGFNDLATKRQDLLEEWDFEENNKNGIFPTDILPSYKHEVSWKCKFGHKWKNTPRNRHRSIHHACPECSKRGVSYREKYFHYYLQQAYPSVIENYLLPKDEVKRGSSPSIDMYIPEHNIGIEYDGNYFHSTAEKKTKDKIKNEKCKKLDMKLIRIRENGCSTFNDDKIIEIFTDTKISALNETIKKLIYEVDLITNKESNISVDLVRDIKIIEDSIAKFYGDKSLSAAFPNLAKEYDTKQNIISPERISSKSADNVWWKCGNPNHPAYPAKVSNRTTRGDGCPFCSNRQILPGVNDLATNNPSLKNEWHPTKNTKKSNQYPPHSPDNVWWLCSICGWEWEDTIAHRNDKRNPRGCANPECPTNANKLTMNRCVEGYNDLESSYPEVAKDWKEDKNGIASKNVSKYSNIKYSWECHRCGYEWEEKPTERTSRNRRCPRCFPRVKGNKFWKDANDLATLHPELLDYWDYEKNEDLPTEIIGSGHRKQFYWKCNSCNEASLYYIETMIHRKPKCQSCGKQMKNDS